MLDMRILYNWMTLHDLYNTHLVFLPGKSQKHHKIHRGQKYDRHMNVDIQCLWIPMITQLALVAGQHVGEHQLDHQNWNRTFLD